MYIVIPEQSTSAALKTEKEKLDIIWCFFKIMFIPSFKTVNSNRVGPDIYIIAYEKERMKK
jgi:hypothetical protein